MATTTTPITDTEPVRYRSDEGAECALLVLRGPRYLHVISTRPPIRVAKLPLEEERYMVPLELGGGPYPIRRIVRALRRIARRHGGTVGALQTLKRITP